MPSRVSVTLPPPHIAVQKAGDGGRSRRYGQYLNRRAAGQIAAKKSAKANPSLVATLPNNSVRDFLTYVLSKPETFIGIWFFEVSPKVTAHHTRPLQKMPSGPLSYELRMQRRASVSGAPDHKEML